MKDTGVHVRDSFSESERKRHEEMLKEEHDLRVHFTSSVFNGMLSSYAHPDAPDLMNMDLDKLIAIGNRASFIGNALTRKEMLRRYEERKELNLNK